MKNILIIKCGEPQAKIKSQYAGFEDWIIKASGLSKENFRVINLPGGEPLRHPQDFAATIITDSQHHINQRLPWIPLLKNWIVSARYSSARVLGIGFGMHALIEAFGGKVTPLDSGPYLGTSFVNIKPDFLNDPLFKNTGNSFESYLNFSREVTTIPPVAEVLAQNSAGQIMAVKLNTLYGIQFTPEIPEKVFKQYIMNSKLPTKARLGVKLSSEYKNQSILPNFLTTIQNI